MERGSTTPLVLYRTTRHLAKGVGRSSQGQNALEQTYIELAESPPNWPRNLTPTARSRRSFTQLMTQDLSNKSHQVPDEFLADIIRRAALNLQLDSDTHLLSDPTFSKYLQNYRSVCKRWKSLIDGNPTLWTFLSADTPSPELLERAIARSGNALVVISYGPGTMEREQFVKMVAPQMHRCKALWMNGREPDGSAPALESLLGTRCPNLEELHYWFSAKRMVKANKRAAIERPKVGKLSRSVISALQNNAQRLRTLEFGQAGGWGTGVGLPNLEELKLKGSELTVGQLVGSLAKLPLLRSLVVDSPVRVRDQETSNESTVELALLTRIELLNVDASFAHAALSRITPPSLKHLALSVRNFDLPVLPLDTIGTHCQRLILSLLEDQAKEPIPIRVGDKFLAVSLSHHETSREFEFSGVYLWDAEDRSRCAQSIVDISKWWGSVSAPSFSLGWGMDTCSEDSGATMFPEFLRPLMDIAAVVKIQVGWRVQGVQHLYQRLSYAVRGKDAEIRRWLLPRLEILEVVGKGVFDGNLVRMLRDRYAAIACANGDLGAPLPFSMVKLVRDSSRKPELDIDHTVEIRSIVGEEHFCFELKSNM